jgi:hypothetical protein
MIKFTLRFDLQVNNATKSKRNYAALCNNKLLMITVRWIASSGSDRPRRNTAPAVGAGVTELF